MKELSKESRIKAEIERMSVKYELIDGNQRAMIAPLLQNAAFMKVTLEDLQAKINEDGVVDTYQNGANQYGTKQSATLQSYNSLVKNYAAVIKAIAQLVPYEKKESTSWGYKEQTPEEKEEEREARDLARDKELNEAMEYQRQIKERESSGQPWVSFQEWRAMQRTSE